MVSPPGVELLYVMVAGPGGAGKSAFIKEALGPGVLDAPVVASGLYPAAKRNVTAFEVPAGVIKGLPPNRRVVLVEVPALRMGGPADDVQIMSDTKAWLKDRNAQAAGVVYLNETNPAKYGIGSMDAKEQLPMLRSWFERWSNPEDTPNNTMEGSNRKLDAVVAIPEYSAVYESALRGHWEQIVGGGGTTESAKRLVLGADNGRWTMESAHSVLRRLDLVSCEVNGDGPTSSSTLGGGPARVPTPSSPEVSCNCFGRGFGC